MGRTDADWEKWGREDPYFGVVTFERFSKANITENRTEFFAMGEQFVADTLARVEDNFGPLKRGDVLDFGCGVGRLTLPLAREFDSAVGLDVAPSMLAEADNNAREFGITNARFALSDDLLSAAPGQFDFVNSYIVLQHIPTRRGMPIIDRLIGKVRPGGGLLIHVSVRNDNMARRALYWMRHNIPGLGMVQNFRRGLPLGAPAMQMNPYPLDAIMLRLIAEGFRNLHVFSEMHGSVMTVGLMGRKVPTKGGAQE